MESRYAFLDGSRGILHGMPGIWSVEKTVIITFFPVPLSGERKCHWLDVVFAERKASGQETELRFLHKLSLFLEEISFTHSRGLPLKNCHVDLWVPSLQICSCCPLNTLFIAHLNAPRSVFGYQKHDLRHYLLLCMLFFLGSRQENNSLCPLSSFIFCGFPCQIEGFFFILAPLTFLIAMRSSFMARGYFVIIIGLLGHQRPVHLKSGRYLCG